MAAVARIVSFTRGFPTPRTLAVVMAGYGMIRVHRLFVLIHYQAVRRKPDGTAGKEDVCQTR